MKIRDRLSLFFTIASSVNLLIVMILIYISFYNYLQEDFLSRLKGRVDITRRLYLDSESQPAGNLAKIKKEFEEKVPGEVINIYDGNNKQVFIINQKRNWSDEQINQIKASGSIQRWDKERFFVGEYFSTANGKFVVIASAQYPERIRKLTEFIAFMILIFVLSIIIIFWMGRWFSQKTLLPINKLIEQLQQINAQSLHKRVSARHHNDEIGLLAQNVNKFITQLETSFELQKAFVASASHEFRTPITSIIGEAEVSLKQDRTKEEYQTVIRSILVESEKLNETISGLIDLAQVDVNFVRAVMIPIRIDDLIWELQEYWSKRLYPNALIVTMDNLTDNESSLIIKGNRSLLTIALNNVIGNGFKFSNNKQVRCVLLVESGHVIIRIVDKGIGIKQENKEKIFEAFFRSERSSGFAGTGIGLHVTQKIVEMLNGKIEVLSLPDSGAMMVLQFPNLDSNA